MTPLLQRDERQATVDAAADRVSFIVLSYGLLALVAIRGFNGEASWDLLGLVIAAGAVGLLYRLRQRVVDRRWLAVLVGTLVIAAIAAAVLALQLPR